MWPFKHKQSRLERAQARAEALWDEVGDTIDDLSSDAKKQWRHSRFWRRKPASRLELVQETLSEQAEALERKASKTSRKLSRAAKREAKEISSQARDLRERAASTTSDVVETVSEIPTYMRSSASDVVSLVTETSEKARQRGHNVVDRVTHETSELLDHTSQQAQQLREGANQQVHKLNEQASEVAHKLNEQASEVAHKVGEQASGVAHKVGEQASGVAHKVSSGISEQTHKVGDRISESAHTISDTVSGIGLKAAAAAALAAAPLLRDEKRSQKKRGFPGFWLWLLRLAVGFWWIESVRNKNMSTLNRGTERFLRKHADDPHHPFPEYQHYMRSYAVPNASTVAVLSVIGELLAGIGMVTGQNKRLSLLIGLLLNVNYALIAWRNQPERGQNLIMAAAEAVLLATDG